MLDPIPHPGVVLKRALDSNGKSIKTAAKEIGVTRSKLSRICSGLARVTPEVAFLLGQWGDVSGLEWYQKQCVYEYAEEFNAKFSKR